MFASTKNRNRIHRLVEKYRPFLGSRHDNSLHNVAQKKQFVKYNNELIDIDKERTGTTLGRIKLRVTSNGAIEPLYKKGRELHLR